MVRSFVEGLAMRTAGVRAPPIGCAISRARNRQFRRSSVRAVMPLRPLGPPARTCRRPP